MKVKTAISYKLSGDVRSFLIYLGFFGLFAFVFPTIGLVFNPNINRINSDLMIPAMIYLMIISMVSNTRDFKLFIQCGMSRLHIFLVNIVASLISSMGVSLVLVGIGHLVNGELINRVVLSSQLTDGYTKNNFLSTWLVLTVFMFLACSIGLVMSTINDRFDGYARLAIGAVWLGIPILLTVLFQLLPPAAAKQVAELVAMMLGITKSGLKVLPLFCTILVCSCLLLTIVFVLNRHREIKRVNA